MVLVIRVRFSYEPRVFRFHEQMEAEEKDLAKIGTEIKPWTLNDADKNIVEPSPLAKSIFGVILGFLRDNITRLFKSVRCRYMEK